MKHGAGEGRPAHRHWGTTLDAFLAEDGIREAAKAEAVTRVVAWQLSQEMERQGITKAGHHQGSARRAHAHQPCPGRSHSEGEGRDDQKPAARRSPRRPLRDGTACRLAAGTAAKLGVTRL
jgi:hypothetical protein